MTRLGCDHQKLPGESARESITSDRRVTVRGKSADDYVFTRANGNPPLDR